MPKYYCHSGDFKFILDAKNPNLAVHKFIEKILDIDPNNLENDLSCSFLIGIGERGFGFNDDTLIITLVPYLRKYNFPLPDDVEIINNVSEQLGKKLSSRQIQWILNGEYNE